MIAFDFQYYKVFTAQEAIATFKALRYQGLSPVYYAGGAEIITLARKGTLQLGAVIDITAIPPCRTLDVQDNRLVLGSGLTLNQVISDTSFPFLSSACRHVADHTNRNKMTLGGNICGRMMYKEALLPLLISDAEAVIAGESGMQKLAVQQLIYPKKETNESDLIVQFHIDRSYLDVPFVFVKKTKQEKVDYPLVTIAAMQIEGQLRVAVSGVCEFPFRSSEMEVLLNDSSLSAETKLERILETVPGPILNDILGSAEFRSYLLKNMLADVLTSGRGSDENE